jgi:hypothetical protein
MKKRSRATRRRVAHRQPAVKPPPIPPEAETFPWMPGERVDGARPAVFRPLIQEFAREP